VLSMAAAAVGLGNIWRFPYVAGENGGATFIIAYVVAVLALGLPLMFMELSAGSIEEGGVVKSFRGVNARAAPFGWLVVALTLIILSYYLVITGWTMGYAIDSLTGSLQTFDDFTDGSAPLIYFGIVTVVSAWVAFRGVDLIERYSVVLMPVLLGVILILSGYGLTLSGRPEALDFLFSPDLSDFASPELWALAFGQAFYSLAIGQGYLMTYGSYLPERVNLPRATATVAGVETTVALVAGLMIFPIVFSFGLDPAEGTDLAFTTLPLAFDDMAIGWLLAVVFFWLFFLAAISSCIASMKVIKTALVEELRTTDGRAIMLAVVALLPLGILSAVSFTPLEVELLGRPFLEFMDLVTANQVVILSGLIGGAILGWNMPRRVVVGLFPDRHRPLALHTIRAVRYLWIFVLLVLTVSLLA
jgi:neurotransmitter:Na+ symporter, NSS family